MTIDELMTGHGITHWVVIRTSRKGNLIVQGEVTYYWQGSPDERDWNTGGTQRIVLTAVVDPITKVVLHDDMQDEWWDC